ncbi:GNAT family N-acetyltransferase [Helicovermis profundi]|uniref:GNAT family protein n=1 Tax=Helicovermis profundi TaxID=3065157 RepID=A0AAU9E4G7_9FIRM|nr:GNAT family protein [Clostridia bacterium S502]
MINFKRINMNDTTIFNILANWDNDPNIKEFIFPRTTTEEIMDVSPFELKFNILSNKTKEVYIVYDDSSAIGYYSIDSEFEYLYTNNPRTAWISIIIGEKSYWGRGIGKLIMKDIEKKCKESGLKYIELGVFEFNTKAQKLYKSLNYEVVGVVKNFVYNCGEWKSDIRMLKALD